MLESDIAEVLKQLRATAEVYGTKLSEGMLTMYASDLAEYPLQDVLESLKRCRRECKFFPKPIDILERLSGSTKKDAEEGLAVVYERLHKGSLYRNYQLLRNGKPDMVLMQTIQDMGGMVEANDKILTSWKWRNDFIDRYIANARHPEMCHTLKTIGADECSSAIQIELNTAAKMILPGVEQMAIEGATA